MSNGLTLVYKVLFLNSVYSRKQITTGSMMNQTNGEQRTQWKQWMAGITATLNAFCMGCVNGWATTSLPRLMAEDSPIIITSDQSSWIVSLTGIGTMIGPFIAATCADTIGRKKTLLLTSLFYGTGWLMVICATTAEELYVSRVIMGTGMGISYTANPTYVSEIADVNVRGAIGTLIAVNCFVGTIFACIVGSFVTVKTHGWILLMVPILFACLFIWFPDTPYYLASKGRYVEATKSLVFFKGISNEREAEEELEVLILNVKQQSESQNWGKKLRKMLLPNNRKALGIIMFLIMMEALSGSKTIPYLDGLFQRSRIGMNVKLAELIVLMIGLISCAFSMLTIEKVGRRILLMTSSLGTCATLAVLASYLFAGAKGIDTTSVNWLPVAVVVLFQLTFQFGLGSVPDVLAGELFPNNVRSIGMAIVTVFDGACIFVVSKLYQVIGDAVGEYVVYYIFAVSCFIAFLFTLALIPETMNKELNQIQKELTESQLSCSKKHDDA